MFYYSATRRLVAGKTIRIFNHGDMRRDFTFIDDIVEGVFRVMRGTPERGTGEDGLPVPPYAVYNIGGGQPESLLDYIRTLQEELVRAGVLPEGYDFEGHRELVGMQAGDVPVTYADSAALERDYAFTPRVASARDFGPSPSGTRSTTGRVRSRGWADGAILGRKTNKTTWFRRFFCRRYVPHPSGWWSPRRKVPACFFAGSGALRWQAVAKSLGARWRSARRSR